MIFVNGANTQVRPRLAARSWPSECGDDGKYAMCLIDKTAAVAFFLFILLNSPGVKAESRENCDFLDPTSPILTATFVQVGKPSIELRVPASYLPPSTVPQGRTLGSVRGLLLYASMNSLEPIPGPQFSGFQNDPNPIRLSVLMEDRRELSFVAKTAIGIYSNQSVEVPPSTSKYEFGLQRIDIPQEISSKDFFFSENSGEISDFILCGRLNESIGIRSPQCSHYSSTTTGIPLIIDYSREYLDYWSKSKEKADRLVECLVQH